MANTDTTSPAYVWARRKERAEFLENEKMTNRIVDLENQVRIQSHLICQLNDVIELLSKK